MWEDRLWKCIQEKKGMNGKDVKKKFLPIPFTEIRLNRQ